MGELIIKVDMLAPAHEYKLKYTGPHPSRLLKEIPEIMIDHFKLETSRFYEDKIKWGIDSDPRDVYGEWRGRDPKDQWTQQWFRIIVHGKQAAQTKIGFADIWISGYVLTKMPTTNVIDELYKKIFLQIFYQKQIENYTIEGKERLDKINRDIRDLFDLMQKEIVRERIQSK